MKKDQIDLEGNDVFKFLSELALKKLPGINKSIGMNWDFPQEVMNASLFLNYYYLLPAKVLLFQIWFNAFNIVKFYNNFITDIVLETGDKLSHSEI